MATARHARRWRRRYYQALAHEQRQHRARAQVEPVNRADNTHAIAIVSTAVVVLMLAAIVLAVSV